MIRLIEHIPWLIGAAIFIFFALPAGFAAMAAFLGFAGAFGPSTKRGEAKVGDFSFKGPLSIGLIVLAIMFAYKALNNQNGDDLNQNSYDPAMYMPTYDPYLRNINRQSLSQRRQLYRPGEILGGYSSE
jgi:hypothetical protein